MSIGDIDRLRGQRGVRLRRRSPGPRSSRPTSAKTNVNGGAIALGHPLGASGARLMASLLRELERTGCRWGLQVRCEGGGLASAAIIERLG